MADDATAAMRLHNAETIPLEDIDVSNVELWRTNSHWPYFARLRREAPVHYCARSAYGPYWSVTRFEDIMAVDTNHQVFSSDVYRGGITIVDEGSGDAPPLPMFIAMDPPKHDQQRKVASPIVAPANLARMEDLIRSRAAAILDALPVGETFDWVDRVSIELTTQMLATLFDFPFEDRRLLTFWSDVATAFPGPGEIVETEKEQTAILMECLEYFVRLWNERVNAEPAFNLISMLAHGESTRDMTPMEYLGNIILLIVGGNDTTRNTITGSILALNQNPDQYQKLRDHPELIPSMVSETIRWQTPLAHMRRTATQDTELGGKRIAKGDKVIMWYVSGNRDERVIDRPDDYIIDRERPVYVASPFTRGYASLKVRIPPSETLAPRPAPAESTRPAPARPAPYRQPRGVLAAASLVSAAAALLFNVMPALLTAAAARFSLDAGQVGVVGSSYLAGFALVAVTSSRWLNRFDWRALVAGGTVVAMASLAACAFAQTYAMLLAALVAAGAGLGVLYTLCIAVVSEHHRPDPAFGVKLTAEVFLGAAALLTLTGLAIPRWGFSGGVLVLAAVVGVAALGGLAAFPAGRALTPPAERFAMRGQRRGAAAMLRDWAPWAGLAGLFVSFAGLSALWAFLTQLAPTFGVSVQAASGAFVAALVASAAGGIAATLIGDRLGRARPLAIGMLLAVGGAAALQWGHGFSAYLTGVVLAVGLWNFPMAYQMGMIASADQRGNVAVLMPAALAVGGALGPALAGALLTGESGYGRLYGLFAVAVILGLAAFIVLGRQLARLRSGRGA
jgi:cytochrome P450/predicted MFS family arabinose efflux permease